MMSSGNLSNLFWELHPHCAKDVELAKRLVSGDLKWEELVSLDCYKKAEPISYLYLSGSILLIGLGWAKQIPISDEAERKTLTHYSLLLISSLFNNFDHQKIIASTSADFDLTIQGETKRKQGSSAFLPSKVHISSTESSTDGSFKDKPVSSPMQDSFCFDSSNCLDLFPKSVIAEVEQHIELPSEIRLRELCLEYWCNEGKQFFNINGQDLCQLATDFFISQKIPSEGHFVFNYNLNSSPWALAEDSAAKINNTMCLNLKKTRQHYVNYYVFSICYPALDDKNFSSIISRKYNMLNRRMSNIIHLAKKIFKIWGKDVPLARMDPGLLSYVSNLKVGEVGALSMAIKQLNTIKLV
ncbi:hypothetical protein DSO57_1026510 [Entomophthora muscae]|uniref:Uncharacterized protein n=2 Tax=Entomophthora muscae TaxID=34485 RepID=A0ACC2RT36_9FUNG|nr:hypothetical protein DSO57_1026510 [Entomophthora muscae]